jgi:hypothetical protein
MDGKSTSGDRGMVSSDRRLVEPMECVRQVSMTRLGPIVRNGFESICRTPVGDVTSAYYFCTSGLIIILQLERIEKL